ncbi:MAG: hypothetical protein DRI57_31970, partial [Deltaproteobacteria bacterium]
EWRGRHLTDFLSFMPFAMPGAILGIGLISVWNRPATDSICESGLIVIFAYIARFSPFAVKAVSTNLRQTHHHPDTCRPSDISESDAAMTEECRHKDFVQEEDYI